MTRILILSIFFITSSVFGNATEIQPPPAPEQILKDFAKHPLVIGYDPVPQQCASVGIDVKGITDSMAFRAKMGGAKVDDLGITKGGYLVASLNCLEIPRNNSSKILQ